MCMSPILVNVKNSLIVNEIYGAVNGKSTQIWLPCGKCDDCRVSHSKEWALRAILELVSRSKKEQLKCWFLTLTYDNNNLPENGKLNLAHVSLFVKKLRHYFEKRNQNVKIKYFVCGEYGTKNYRPHYHMLVYGLPLNDLKVYKQVGQFDFLWMSQFLEKFWNRGFVVIGNLNYKTAYYTCRYTLKKYDNCDIKMSCSNGFGKQWCLDHMNELVANGYLSYGGRKYLIPKYFLKLIRKIYFNYQESQQFFKQYSLDDAFDNKEKKMLMLHFARKQKFGDLEVELLKREDDICKVNWDYLIDQEIKNRKCGSQYAKWLVKRQCDRVLRMNKLANVLKTDEYFVRLDNKICKNRFVSLDTGELNLGGLSKTQKEMLKNKRLINQSLFALYHNRNNFV